MTYPPLAPLRTDASVDVLIAGVVATRALVNALHAHELSLLAAAGEAALASGGAGGADLSMRSLSAEVGAATRVSDRTVQRQVCEAMTLLERFPATHTALASGLISRAHVSVIMEAGWHITDPAARSAYEASVLGFAVDETAARLRPVARVRAERVAPSSLQERHDRARAGRGVRVTDLDDGMSELVATLPSVLAHGAFDRLTALAHDVRAAAAASAAATSAPAADEASAGGMLDGVDVAPDSRGEAGQPSPFEQRPEAPSRSMDELRADILADLVLAAAPSAHETPTGLAAIRAQVQVVVPALTLIPGPPSHESDAAADGDGHRGPAELVGHGPIDPETARRLAGHAPGWDRVLTHPVSGAVLAVDRYRPSEDIKRALRVRDRHCRFVGCRQPVHRCDLDHTIDAARGGVTADCNLAHLCRRHHILKHHTAWTVRQLADGVLEWTSPGGLIYIDTPLSNVVFAPTVAPPEPPHAARPDRHADPPPF
jgi:hypothetical protein